MEFPDGMKKIPGHCLEIKALQGTKQGAYSWHVTARRVPLDMGFQMAVTPVNLVISKNWTTISSPTFGYTLTISGAHLTQKTC